MLRSAKFHSADFPGLSELVHTFLKDGDVGLEAACFGIPGPVIDNRASTPNLAWVIDGGQVAADLRVRHVALINDLVATAEGIPLLAADEVAVLQEGIPESQGNRALIAAGTGLGMSLLPRVGDRWVPVPSEGGHADYPPRTEDEIDLVRRQIKAAPHRWIAQETMHLSTHPVFDGHRLTPRHVDLRAFVFMGETPKVGPTALTRVAETSVICPSAALDRVVLVLMRCFHAAATSAGRCRESMPGWWTSTSRQNSRPSV